jgi:peptide/nickel transport system substrate-binding protein
MGRIGTVQGFGRRTASLQRPSLSGKWSRRVALAGVAAVTLVVAACTGGSNNAAEPSPSSLSHTVVTFADPPGQGSPNYIFPMTSPQYINTTNDQELYLLMWRPLYWFGNNGTNPVPNLNPSLSIADTPVYSDNNHTVTINLKPYSWSDGTPVTCRDVEFWMNLWESNPENNFGPTIPGVTPDILSTGNICPNPSTVVFHIKGSYNPTWVTQEALSFIVPLPQHAWDKTSANGPIGNYDETKSGALAVYNFLSKQGALPRTFATNPLWKVVDGPWKLANLTLQGQATFVANPKYSGPDKPTFAKYVEEPFTSYAAEYNAILTGSVDYGYLPVDDIPQIQRVKQMGYNVDPWYWYAINYIFPNYANPTSGPLVSQLYIRQALQELINQPQDITDIYHGYAYPTYGPIPSPPSGATPGGIYSFIPSGGEQNPYPFSTTAAAKLLSAHGWHVVPNGTSTCTNGAECGKGIATGAKLELSLNYPTALTEITDEFEAFQSAASNIGIHITLLPTNYTELSSIYGPCTSKSSTCWQMGSWGGSAFYYFNQFPDGGGPFEGAAMEFTMPGYPSVPGSGTLDTLIQQVRVAPTQAAIEQALQAYEAYAAKSLPVLWLPEEYYQISVVKNNLGGVIPQNALGNITPELWK